METPNTADWSTKRTLTLPIHARRQTQRSPRVNAQQRTRARLTPHNNGAHESEPPHRWSNLVMGKHLGQATMLTANREAIEEELTILASRPWTLSNDWD